MTDKPIIFSAPMVRAILREIEAPGTGKTQTRRLLKPQPDFPAVLRGFLPDSGDVLFNPLKDALIRDCQKIRLPYRPGDRLWVRETWAAGACANGLAPKFLHPGFWRRDNGGLWFAADGAAPLHPVTPKGPNRATIHMPRWASRLTLHVTDVRVQRLQDISEADAVAEGCPARNDEELAGMEASGWFCSLWDDLNAKRAPWASNPWVVAITFLPALGNIDGEGQ